MTVPSTISRNDYTGNGAVNIYSYTFKIFAASHLQVLVRTPAGVQLAALVLGVDYSVSGVGALNGGSITLINAGQSWLTAGFLSIGYHLTIKRVLPISQTTAIRNQGTYYAGTHEDEFDKLTMVDQQQEDAIDRSVKLADSIDPASFDTTLPSALVSNPGATVVVNPAGTGFEVGPDAGDIAAAQANAAAAAASATASAASATASAGSAVSAAASAAAAATAAASVIWNDVVFITVADSPFSITAAHRGKLIAVDASGGPVAVSLPQISGLNLSTPYVVGVKKTDASGNAVTISRASTDTIDGNTTKSIQGADSGTTLIPDTGPAPDEWTSADFGQFAANITVNRFSGTGAQTNFTLTIDPGTENNTWVFVNGDYRQKDVYSITGTTLTFAVAPPSGTDNIEVMIGTVLNVGTVSDASITEPKFATGAVSKRAMDVTTTTAGREISNLTLVASVGAGALTVAVKTLSGTDPTASDPVTICFRNASGTYVRRQITAALSFVISSGSTLGIIANIRSDFYIHAVDNSGVIVLGISATFHDEGVQTTTFAEGGAGAADSAELMYTPAGLSTKSIRILARARVTLATPGTWNVVPDLALFPFNLGSSAIAANIPVRDEVWLIGGNGQGSTNTRVRRFTTLQTQTGSLAVAQSATLGDTVTVQKPGLYCISYADGHSAQIRSHGISINSAQLTTNIEAVTDGQVMGITTNAVTPTGVNTTVMVRLVAGDVIRAHLGTGGGQNLTATQIVQLRVIKVSD